MKSISCLITCHNEGEILQDSYKSVVRNLAEIKDLKSEVIICLDRPDDKTSMVVDSIANTSKGIKVKKFDLGDVGLVRQEALNSCEFDYVAFLDADDFWGSNWLLRSNNIIKDRTDIILHPDLTIFFDTQLKYVRKNPDSSDRNFDKAVLLFENLWTSSFITPRQIMLDIPMKSGSTYDDSPYAYEDWSWFRETLIAGYQHRIVKKTVHFQRIRPESNTTRSVELKKEPWPVDIKKLLF